MTRILVDRELSVPDEILVKGQELHYLTRVRRHRPGDRVELQDKGGARFSARVNALEKDRASLTVEGRLEEAGSAWPVKLIIAVPKRNLMDDVVRKASEIGLERIAPVSSERSVVRPGPDRVERWRRIARESLRQCGREEPLAVDPILPLEEALERHAGRGTTLILHPVGAEPSEGFFDLAANRPLPLPITAAIGPEGGFSETELARARALGYRPIRLGPTTMRVETAAIAAGVLCVALLGGY